LVSAEIFIIVLTSGILSSVMMFLVNLYSNELVRRLVIR